MRAAGFDQIREPAVAGLLEKKKDLFHILRQHGAYRRVSLADATT
jgi:muconolactone delta-isomerase